MLAKLLTEKLCSFSRRGSSCTKGVFVRFGVLCTARSVPREPVGRPNLWYYDLYGHELDRAESPVVFPKLLVRRPRAKSRQPSRPRRERLEADLLTRPDIEAVLNQCPVRSWTGHRNRALIVVLWRTGLRISEALALREKDVDLIEGRLVVQHGKGGKRRVVGLDQGTIDVMKEWLLRRAAIAPPVGAPVLCTQRGGRIDPSYVRRLLPRLAREAGVGKRVHAHGLRHAFATELQAEGAPLSMIRDLLGHSSLATTDTYLRRLGAGDAVDFARARTWNPTRAGRRPLQREGSPAANVTPCMNFVTEE